MSRGASEYPRYALSEEYREVRKVVRELAEERIAGSEELKAT